MERFTELARAQGIRLTSISIQNGYHFLTSYLVTRMPTNGLTRNCAAPLAAIVQETIATVVIDDVDSTFL